jgi:O-antigen ligase
MSAAPDASSILSCDEWVGGDVPSVRLPLVGTVSAESILPLASRAAFVLLLAAAGTLLVHPGDLAAGLEDVQAYRVLLAGCILTSLPALAGQLRMASVRGNAITCLVLLTVVAAGAPYLAGGDRREAWRAVDAVGKVSLLYLLVVGVVNSVPRLRAMLAAVAAFVLCMTAVALLQYHGVVHLPGLAHVERHAVDATTDRTTVVVRLCGIGLFNDPNDLSLVLVVSVAACAYFLAAPRRRPGERPALAGCVGLLLYALYLTHSRGGAIAAVSGLLVYLYARASRRDALALTCLVVPLLTVAMLARPATAVLADTGDTFQTRLELWSGTFDAFRSAPLLGIGQGRLVDVIGEVAHNSFLHAYAEMGLLGGTAFIGTFYLALRGLWRAAPADPELARLRPYLLAALASYAAGLLSLSRCYHAPTQLMIAITTAYLLLASRGGAPVAVPPMDGPCLRRISMVGLLFLAASYAFLRLMLQRGAP